MTFTGSFDTLGEIASAFGDYRDHIAGLGLGPLPAVAPALLAAPDALDLAGMPEDYAERFPDVARARDLGLIADPALHWALYGRAQGRGILARWGARSGRVVMISPSHEKQCGIGEWGRYLAGEIARAGHQLEIVRSSDAARALDPEYLRDAIVLVNHGPGIYDGLNARLSQGESTASLLANLIWLAEERGALPIFLHHSLVDEDQHLLYSRQQQIRAAPIPQITFVSSAGRHFFLPATELGISPVAVPPYEQDHNREYRTEVLGFFGFFQYGGKDFDALFHLAHALQARIVGSVATANGDELKLFEEALEKRNIPYDFGSGWVDDAELLQRLLPADYFYLPQKDYDHWNNSATARFVTNMDRPLFLPPHHPFLDMADGAIFADTIDLPRVAAHFREGHRYAAAVERVRAFRARAAMARTAEVLTGDVPVLLDRMAGTLMEEPGALSLERILGLSEPARARAQAALGVEETDGDGAALLARLPAPLRSVPTRAMWRVHYDLDDLTFPSLLDSVHAIWIGLAKRPPKFAEMAAAVAAARRAAQGLPGEAGGRAPSGRALARALAQALQARGTPFRDERLTLLDEGRPVDPGRDLSPDALEARRTVRATTRAEAVRIAREAGTGPQGRLTNLVELISLPPEAIARRDSPVDLSGIDFAAVRRHPGLPARLNALLAAAARAGVDLAAHFVLDHPLVPQIEPGRGDYAVEDFLWFKGDALTTAAIRAIEKRDPYPLEILALSGMAEALGPRRYLSYLLARGPGWVRIDGLGDPDRDLPRSEDRNLFLSNIRDPLMGLVDARNAYEIARRDGHRHGLRTKAALDALWAETGGRVGLMRGLYADLADLGRDPDGPDEACFLTYLGEEGQFNEAAGGDSQSFALGLDETAMVGESAGTPAERAFRGFFGVEPIGVWTEGRGARLEIAYDEGTAIPFSQGRALEVTVSSLGSTVLGPRELTLTLRHPGGTERLTHTVTTDAATTLRLPCRGLPKGGTLALEMSISSAISPEALGMSPDTRALGLLLTALRMSSAAS